MQFFAGTTASLLIIFFLSTKKHLCLQIWIKMTPLAKRPRISPDEKLPFQQNPTLTRKEVLKWEFEDMANWNGNLMYSDPFVFDKITWKIGVKRTEKREFNIYVVLNSCDVDGRGWLIKTDYVPKLHFQNGKVETSFVIESYFHHDFCFESTPNPEYLFGFFELTNETRNTELLMVEIALEFAFYDFNSKISSLPNVVLKVDNVPLYFNKYLLASNSKYFYDIIKGEDDDTQEIKIDDVTLEEMTSFLAAICLIPIDVTEENYQLLLDMARKFSVPQLFKKCEQFLKNESEMELTEKIELADKYGLQGFLDTIGDEFESVAHIKTYANSIYFRDLKKETQVLVLRCLLNFEFVESDDEE